MCDLECQEVEIGPYWGGIWVQLDAFLDMIKEQAPKEGKPKKNLQ
jgi:hypothetical protein